MNTDFGISKGKRSALSKRLERARKKMHLTYKDLSNELGVDTTTIFRTFTGETRKINPFILKKLAEILELDYKELFVIAGYINKEDFSVEDHTIKATPLTWTLPIYKVNNTSDIFMKREIGHKQFLASECSDKSFAIQLTNNLYENIGDLGDLAIIDPHKIVDILDSNNEIYFLRYKGKHYIRRVFFPNDNIVILKNLNDKHKDFYLETKDISDLDLIGKLIKVIRETKY